MTFLAELHIEKFYTNMQLALELDIPVLPQPISYKNSVMLIGSCFTEHISERLALHKFDVLSNPNGILFNPLSVANSLTSYIDNYQYKESELFYLNELWNSWQHHTRFSNIDKQAAQNQINDSQKAAASFIRKADWLIITLGSAFQYSLKEKNITVANNHRAPAQWFEKKLLSTHEITDITSDVLDKLFAANPYAKVLFTISPVRHVRDGVIDNNRSKARLIEAVHALCSRFEKCFYFPAYELVIDILRDYRFYDIDFVHPNYLATNFVWEKFIEACITPDAKPIMNSINEIMSAKAHRSRFPETEANKRFKTAYAEKAKILMRQYPFLDLNKELQYFES